MKNIKFSLKSYTVTSQQMYCINWKNIPNFENINNLGTDTNMPKSISHQQQNKIVVLQNV